MTRLSISTQYTLKDRPEEFRGKCGEHVSYGKDTAIPLARRLALVSLDVVQWYAQFTDAETIKEQRDKFEIFIGAIEVNG